MTDFASLVLEMDASQIKTGIAELDRLAASGGKTTRAVNELAAANKAADLAASRAAAGLVQAASAEGQLRMQAGGATAELNKQAAAASRVVAAGHAVTASAGAQRAGMQQLSYQIGDVTQQFAMGTNPMTIFAQQGGQVVQALSMMKGGAGGLIGFLAGPWGTVIMGATMILGTMASAHLGAADASDKHKDAADDLEKAINSLNDATIRSTQSTYAGIQADIDKANSLRQRAIETRKTLVAELELAQSRAGAAGASVSAGAPGYSNMFNIGEQGKQEASAREFATQIAAQNALIAKSDETIRLQRGQMIGAEVAAQYDASAAAALKYDRALDGLNGRLRAGTITESAYRQELGRLTTTRQAEEEAAKAANRTHRERKAGLTDEQRALESATKAAESYLAGLTLETASIGKNAIELKAMAVEAAAAAAPTAALANSIRNAGAAWLFATKARADSEMGKYLEGLEREVQLVGLTGFAREEATLAFEKEGWIAEQAAKGVSAAAAAWERYAQARLGKVQAESLIERDKKAAEAAAEALKTYLDMTTTIDLDGVFGQAGKAFGSLLNSMDQMIDRQEKYNAAMANTKLTAAELAAIQAKHARLEINNYANLVGAMKGFFKENSKGYKAMHAAETAFRAIELAMAIKTAAVKIGLIGGVAAVKVGTDATMAASDTARAGVEQSNSIATTAIKAVEAVVNAIKSMPFPLNIAAGAATAAVIAGLGVAIGGGFGGGGGAKPIYNEGKGTVFGDGQAQSESIKNSIDQLTSIDTLTMRYSSQMLASLRSIESNIGGLANLVLRTTGIDDLSASVQTGSSGGSTGGAIVGSILGPIGALLGSKLLKGLFGTKTSIIGQGITAGPQSMGDILGGGFDASYFTDVQKKKKLFGITTGTSYSTQTTGASAEIEQQFGLVLKGFYDSILAASGPLGMSLDAVKEKLATFTVDIGKIDLKGLTGAEIQEKLTAVFGAAADKMAQYAMAGLEQYQQAGEGYFETMIRVAQTVEASRQQFGMLGVSVDTLTIGVSMALTDLFGGLQNMVAATGEYFSLYYTAAEQTAARTAQLTDALAGLGLTMPTTMAGYRALVDAQDLSTTAGQSAYAMLIQLAPAFADLTGAMQDTASAAAIASERLGLEKQLLQLQGNTAALRAMELTQLDASNRALQKQIWALEDATKAREAASNTLATAYNRESQELAATASKFTAFGDNLRTFRATLFATDGATGNAYRNAQVKLMTTGALAASGDAGGLGDLQSASKTFLDAAMNNASTSQQYQRDVAMVAQYVEQGILAADGAASVAEQQLAEMKTQVGALIDINDSVVSVHDAILAMTALNGGAAVPGATAAEPQAREERDRRDKREDRMERMFGRMVSLQEQSAASVDAMSKVFKASDRGGAIAIVTDSDAPIATTVAV